MNIILREPNADGSRPPILPDKTTAPEGWLPIMPGLDTNLFYDYNGFVTLTIQRGMVTGMEANVEAWEAWKESLPEPEPPTPSAQEDTDAMLVDHEYRLTMLELGIVE